MTQLLDHVKWEVYPISDESHEGKTQLKIGKVGTGKPSGMVVAGIHGDEGPWGAWAIRKFLETTKCSDILGSLYIVPVANPLAMEADSRNAPVDGLDLNRSFPGSFEGSYTGIVARTLVDNAVMDSSIVIDLHGGGSWCVNAFTFLFPGCRDLSDAFSAPFTVEGTIRENTLTGYALSKGARVVAVEMGGVGHKEEEWASRIAEGIRRAMGIAGILKIDSNSNYDKSTLVGLSEILTPNENGIFMPVIRGEDVGTVVKKGVLLGRLLDPVTMDEIGVFEAPYTKTAILLLRPTLAYIEKGAMTYVVAPVNIGDE